MMLVVQVQQTRRWDVANQPPGPYPPRRMVSPKRPDRRQPTVIDPARQRMVSQKRPEQNRSAQLYKPETTHTNHGIAGAAQDRYDPSVDQPAKWRVTTVGNLER